MSPGVGEQDIFEGTYTGKFRSIARKQGEFVLYERDRAAIDIGVHFTEPMLAGRALSHTRIWFQLKGIRASTLRHEEYKLAHEINLVVRLDHLKFWYASPEPIYVVVYIESADEFLMEDVREIVHRVWGERFLEPSTFPEDQKEVTIKLSKATCLKDSTWEAMRRHQSMRLDGPFFRGRALGHRLDPLRSSLTQLEPATFCRMIARLLEVHGYSIEEEFDPALLFPGCGVSDQEAVLTRGTLYYTFEWVWQMSTEFGLPSTGDFRIEGKPLSAQGPCAVLIHGSPKCYPDRNALREFAGRLITQGARQFLTFANLDDPGYLGVLFSAMRESGISCVPQLLGEISYSLLTATVVYLEFREAVSWKYVQYL